MSIIKCEKLKDVVEWIENHTLDKRRHAELHELLSELLKTVDEIRKVPSAGADFLVKVAEGSGESDGSFDYSGYTLRVRFNLPTEKLKELYGTDWGMFFIMENDEVVDYKFIDENTVFESIRVQ